MTMTKLGMLTRPLTLDDAERYAEIATAIAALAGANEMIQAQSILLEWEEPHFDLGSSSLGICDEAGQLIAYAVIWAPAETPVRPRISWGIHPDFRADALSQQLLGWGAEKGAEVIPRCPPEARISLWGGAYKGYAFAEGSLERAGYILRREWYDMRIDMTERPRAQPLPAGFHYRPYRHEDDLPVMVDVVRDSFSDHFGYVEQSFETDLAEFRHWLNGDPYFDPALVWLAVEDSTDVVAGCLMGLTQDHRNPESGCVDMVGVRRDYRQRGLATTMLKHSFAAFWDRGVKAVCLVVDGDSLTNAVSLYQRVGMRVVKSYLSYEKVLREGVELAKVALE